MAMPESEFTPVGFADDESTFTPVGFAEDEQDFTPVGFADEEPQTPSVPVSSTSVAPVVPQVDPRSAAREEFVSRMKEMRMFPNLTDALTSAADKQLVKENGVWRTPMFGQTADENAGYLETLGSMASGVAQSLLGKFGKQSSALDTELKRLQFKHGLNDEDMTSMWSDLGNQYRQWDKDEPTRVLSDGRILLNPTFREILDDDAVNLQIDAAPTTPERKAEAKASLRNVQVETAGQRLESYEAMSNALNSRFGKLYLGPTYSPQIADLKSPTEWAAETGRKVENTPEFVRDYENAVVKPKGAVGEVMSGLAMDWMLGQNKLATTVLGIGGAAGVESMAQKAAEGQEAAQILGAEKPDTGLAGGIVQEIPSLGAQIVTGRLLGAAGALATGTTKGAQIVANVGTVATAGAQSMGMQYADSRLAGKSHEEAQEDAVKAGVNTALITGVFQAMGAGGVEAVAAGKQVAGVTVRDLLKVQTGKELFNNTRQFVARTLKAAGGEAAEEGIDQITSAFLGADPDTNLSDAWDQAFKAAALGGLLGGGVDIVSGAVETPEIRQAQALVNQAKPDAPAAAAAAQQVVAMSKPVTPPTTTTEPVAESPTPATEQPQISPTGGLPTAPLPEGPPTPAAQAGVVEGAVSPEAALSPERENVQITETPTPTENEIQVAETGGLPSEQGQPVVSTAEGGIEEGVAPREGDGQEGQVTPSLYRQSSVRNALDFISPDTTTDTTLNDVFVAQSPEMAIGQGDNKGLMIEFDGAALKGKPNLSKPGTLLAMETGQPVEMILRNYTQDEYRNAVKSVSYRPDELTTTFDKRMMSTVEKRLISQGWTKSVEEGVVKLSRPTVQPTTPNVQDTQGPTAETTQVETQAEAPAGREPGGRGEAAAVEGEARAAALTEEQYARHAELERKQADGTITDAERREAGELVSMAYSDWVNRTVSLPTPGGYEWLPATFVRFGDAPTKDGNQVASTGFNGGVTERGISAFAAWRDPKTGKLVLQTGSGQSLAGVDELVLQNRPVIIVSGVPTGFNGSDGEPLLKPGTVREIERVTFDDVVTDDYPYITLEGTDLEGDEVPSWKGMGQPFPNTSAFTGTPLSERFGLATLPSTPTQPTPQPTTRESLKQAFDLTDTQAAVSEALAEALGVTGGMLVTRGGVPGSGAVMQGGAPEVQISVGGRTPMKVLLSKNTIPGEKPYRATWFQDNGDPAGHTDLSYSEYERASRGDDVRIEDGDFNALIRTTDPRNPLENHPDLGISIGSGIKDGSLENRVLNHSQRMQRGYPEIYATIQTSLPKALKAVGEYATGIRTAIYEHIGDLAHRSGSSEVGAMKDKIRRHALSYGSALTSKLQKEIEEQDENNAAFQIAIRREKAGGEYDIRSARNSPEYQDELAKAKSNNKLLDATYAAMYSRLQSFTPLQAAGRNMAIAFGMRRYALYHNLASKIDEFFKVAEDAGIKSEDLYKLGFNIEGVNNLSRTNNELSQQWETNKKLIEAHLENVESSTLPERAQNQLREQISHQDLAAPIAMLDALIERMKTGGDIRFQSPATTRLTEAQYARHAELEAKHRAGTITDAERREAAGLVEEAARKAGALEVWRGHESTNRLDTRRATPTFTTERRVAEIYATDYETGKVSKSFVTLANPLRFDDPTGAITKSQFEELARSLGMDDAQINRIGSSGDWMDDGDPSTWEEAAPGSYIDFFYLADNTEFSDAAKNAGYDGFIYHGMFVTESLPSFEQTGRMPLELRPFSSSQIKSADPFTGTPLSERFDPTSPDIRFQFAGEKANVPQFMRDSLDTAKAMAAAGKSSEEIRAVTGWFPGPYDGKMRWEIPDNGASAVLEAMNDLNKVATGRAMDMEPIPLWKLLRHENLFKAYPKAMDIQVGYYPSDERGGSFVSGGDGGKDSIILNAPKGQRLRNDTVVSTLLHEIQHWIQEQEGFAKGSSESSMNAAIAEASRIPNTPEARAFWGDERVDAAVKLNSVVSPYDKTRAFKLYLRAAGEIEARDVQARAKLTPEQLAATAPYSSENIAPEAAVVLYQGPKGSTEIVEAGKVLVRGLNAPDFTTATHEMIHAARMLGFPTLTPEQVTTLEEWAGAKDGNWDVAADEKLARGWERYLASGRAPLQRLQAAFDAMARWFRDVYGKISGSDIDVEISDAVRGIFDTLTQRMEISPEVQTALEAENAANPVIPEGTTLENTPSISYPGNVTIESADGSPLPPAIDPTPENLEALRNETDDEAAIEQMVGILRGLAARANVPPSGSNIDYDAPDDFNPEDFYSLQYRQAMIEAERMGYAPDWKQASRTFKDNHAAAMIAEDNWRKARERGENPGWGEERAGEHLLNALIKERQANPDRALSDREIAHLTLEGLERRKAVRAALERMASLPPDAPVDVVKAADDELATATNYHRVLLDFAAGARTTSGRNLNAWKQAIREDYSPEVLYTRNLARINRARKEADLPLLDKLPQVFIDKLMAFSKRMEQLDSEITKLAEQEEGTTPDTSNAEMQAEIDRLQAEVAALKVKHTRRHATTEVVKKLQKSLDAKADEALERLRARGIKLLMDTKGEGESPRYQMGMDTDLVKDLALVASRWFLKEPAMTAARFADLVRNNIGAAFVSMADKIMAEAYKVFVNSRAEITGEDVPNVPAAVGRIYDIVRAAAFGERVMSYKEFVENEAARPDVVDTLKGVKWQGKLTRKDVYDIAKAHAYEGKREFEILDATHATLAELFPDITRQEVSDIFTQYGQSSRPTAEPVAAAVRKARALELVQRQIEALEAGEAVKKTGEQRDKPDATLRQLRKKRDDLMKELGYEQIDPATQLASAQSAAMRRMENEIEEREKAMASGTPIVVNRGGLKYTESMLETKARLDAVREAYFEMFRSDLTPEQKNAKMVKYLDNRIKYEEQLIDEGILERAKEPKPEESEAVLARRDALRETRQRKRELYEAAHPGELAMKQAHAEADAAIKAREKLLAAGVPEVAKGKKSQLVDADEDLKSKWRTIDALDGLITQIRKDRENSPEREQKRLDESLRRYEKTRDMLKSRIYAEQIGVQPKKETPADKDARIAAIRRENQLLRQEITQMQRDRKIGSFSDEAMEARKVGTLEKAIAELRRRRAEKDYTKKKKPKPVTSQRIRDLETLKELERFQFEQEAAKEAYDQLSRGAKTRKKVWAALQLRQTLNLTFDAGAFNRQLAFFTNFRMFRRDFATTSKAIFKAVNEGRGVFEGIKDATQQAFLTRMTRELVRSLTDPKVEVALYNDIKTHPLYAKRREDYGFKVLSPHDSAYELRPSGEVAVDPLEIFPKWVFPILGAMRGVSGAFHLWLTNPLNPATYFRMGASIVLNTALGFAGKTAIRKVESLNRIMLNMTRWEALNALEQVSWWEKHTSKFAPRTETSMAEAGRNAIVTLGQPALKGVAGQKLNNALPVLNTLFQFFGYFAANVMTATWLPVKTAGQLFTGRNRYAALKTSGAYLDYLAGLSAQMAFFMWIFGPDDEDEENREKIGIVMNLAHPKFLNYRFGNYYIDPSNNRIAYLRSALQLAGAADKKMSADQIQAFEESGEGMKWPSREEFEGYKDMNGYDKWKLVTNLVANRLQANIQFGAQSAIGEYREGGPLSEMTNLQATTKVINEFYSNLFARDTEKILSEVKDPDEAANLIMLILFGTGVQRPETTQEREDRKSLEESLSQEIGR